MILRPATLQNVPAFLTLKRELVFEVTTGTTTRGGFLLGTDAEGYAQRIQDGEAWVMDDGEVQGFAIVLPDAPFRDSEVWQRRDVVRWDGIDPERFDRERLCYFDQLAVRRGSFRNRRWGACLAFHTLRRVLLGHDHLITATVSEPVINLAAVPYLRRAGATCVGRLDEVYEPIGPLVSDIWLLSRESLEHRMAHPVGDAERWVLDTSSEWM